MQWLSRAVFAAAVLGCAVPKALAENETHWLTDPKGGCALFDGNAQAGDTVSWSGDCADGLATGQGTATFSHGGVGFETVTANFAKGVAQDGHLTARWGHGWSYDGDSQHGQFYGAGVLTNDNKDRFEGNWIDGKMSGQGVLTRADGEIYDGAWKDDQPNGEGTLKRADGTTLKGLFIDGKFAKTDAKPEGKPDAKPDAQAFVAEKSSSEPFAGLSGKKLVGIDGSSIALTVIEGGIERQITDAGAAPKKTTFTFMNDRMGTVVEDGITNVTGFFRLTANGVEVRYADDRTETLSANDAGGVLMALDTAGQTTCRSWYPQDHVFSDTDKKAALAAYASKLGLQPAPVRTGCAAPAAAIAEPKPRPEKHAEAKAAKPLHTAFAAAGANPGKLVALQDVTVKNSVVHAIDAGGPVLAGPVISGAADGDAQDASHCLKVESDGHDWGFRNACGFAVQFAYCVMHGEQARAACSDAMGGVGGSVAANGFGALSADRSLSEKGADHDFRWIACKGGAGDVSAQLTKIDPPAGRCDRAAAITASR